MACDGEGNGLVLAGRKRLIGAGWRERLIGGHE